MACDPQSILLAYDEYLQELHERETMIYGAQGIKIPPRRQPTKKQGSSFADSWRIFAATHNARFAERQRSKG
jgi:hypothetical protein